MSRHEHEHEQQHKTRSIGASLLCPPQDTGAAHAAPALLEKARPVAGCSTDSCLQLGSLFRDVQLY